MKSNTLAEENIGIHLDQPKKEQSIVYEKKMIEGTVTKYLITSKPKYTTPLELTEDKQRREQCELLPYARLYPQLPNCSEQTRHLILCRKLVPILQKSD